jgi:hypothetical protein
MQKRKAGPYDTAFLSYVSAGNAVGDRWCILREKSSLLFFKCLAGFFQVFINIGSHVALLERLP